MPHRRRANARAASRSRGRRCLLVLVLLVAPVVVRGATRTSPFAPPPANDRVFVTDDAAFLDTDCLYRNSGPIAFDIVITRYVGEVDGNGTLRDVDTLVANGIVSATATLQLPVFDIDFDAEVDPPDQPERDAVSLNGNPLGFLTGADGVWKLNTFEIPIAQLKFPPRGELGSTPDPVLNTVRIDVDVANTRQLWCTAVDWGLLTFKAMSPVIMIHGNNSKGRFFENQGFKGYLDQLKIPNDNSITMITAPISTHAAELNAKIAPIVERLGVDSVHLVAHSKGGLDTREWLATYYPAADFKVLSLTTLSTPHRGSPGADFLVAQQQAAFIEGGGLGNDLLSRVMGVDAGTPDLTTWSTAAFNAENAPLLPPEITYRAVGADADQNGNGLIDFLLPDEFAGSRLENTELRTVFQENPFLASLLITAPYRLIRAYAGVAVEERDVIVLGQRVSTYTVGVAIPGGQPNDTLVPITSAAGPGFTFLPPFVGSEGRDHGSIADAGIAATVVPLLRATEQAVGDFR